MEVFFLQKIPQFTGGCIICKCCDTYKLVYSDQFCVTSKAHSTHSGVKYQVEILQIFHFWFPLSLVLKSKFNELPLLTTYVERSRNWVNPAHGLYRRNPQLGVANIIFLWTNKPVKTIAFYKLNVVWLCGLNCLLLTNAMVNAFIIHINIYSTACSFEWSRRLVCRWNPTHKAYLFFIL